MYETEKPNPTDPMQQGDIIRLEYEIAQQDGPELGVIINADCDLAHGKLDGVIVYLPMYAFHTFLERFWAPSFIEGQRQSLVERISNLCSLNKNDASDLLSWLQREQVTEIAERLSQTCKLKKKDAAELSEKLDRLRSCIAKDAIPLRVFAELCRRETNPHQFAHKKIVHAQSSMGEGHFFISELAGESDIGFVVRMRRIFTIDVNLCFPTKSAQLSSTKGDGLSAYRIARLTSVFRFRLAQLFAHQFSRIGLPDDITALGGLAVDDMVTKLLGEPS